MVLARLWQLAGEVLGFVYASGARIARHLRIRAQRPRAIDLSGRAVRRDDPRRRLAFLDPLLERHHHVEDVRALAAATVSHPGYHEQAHRGRHRLVSDGTPDALVEVHARQRRDVLIAPP